MNQHFSHAVTILPVCMSKTHQNGSKCKQISCALYPHSKVVINKLVYGLLTCP